MRLVKLVLLISFYVTTGTSSWLSMPFFAMQSKSPICAQPKLKLYGPKTLYAEADTYLSNSKHRLPQGFGSESFEQEHEGFIKDNCRPIMFYFFNRHAARFPDAGSITRYNESMRKLVAELRSTNNACLNMRSQLNNWKPKMTPNQGNLLTYFGGLELMKIALQFKKLYPTFFNTKTADIRLGVASKLRSIQSGSYFMRLIDGFDLDCCKYTPTDDINHPEYNVQSILDADCYKCLFDKFYVPFLEFHAKYKHKNKLSNVAGVVDEKKQFINRVNSPKAKKPIVERVSRKLGLNITSDTLDSIWDTCKFETGLQGGSVWCSVFDQKDVEAFEYIEDVYGLYKDDNGPKASQEESRPVVSHLLNELKRAIAKAESGYLTPQVYFYFTHATAMKKLFSVFGLFKDEKNYSEDAILEFETKLKVPKKRVWRTALELPFSGSITFTLYRCPSLKEKYQLLTSVTGRPVKLGGCHNSVRCGVESFFKSYDGMLEFDFESICANPTYTN